MKTIDAVFALQAQQHASHDELVKLMNEGFTEVRATCAGLDARLRPVEETRRTLRTALGAVAIQLLVFLGGVVMVLWKAGVR